MSYSQTFDLSVPVPETETDYAFVQGFPAFNVGPGNYTLARSVEAIDGTLLTERGGGSGFMMVLDGATEADQAIWRTDLAVEAGQHYDFSFWAAATSWNFNPVGWDYGAPQLALKVNGVIVADPFLLNGPVAGWTGFSAGWAATETATVRFELVALSTNYWGNDLAIDDIVINAPQSEPLHVVSVDIAPDPIVIDGAPQTVSFTVRFGGDLTGLTSGGIHFHSPNGHARLIRQGELVADGVMSVQMTLNEFAAAGDWRIDIIDWIQNDSLSGVYGSDLEAQGLDVTVRVDNPQGDNVLPVMSGLELDRVMTDTDDLLKLVLVYQDDFSGVASVGFQMQTPSGEVIIEQAAVDPVSGRQEFFLSQPGGLEPGLWTVFLTSAFDRGENFSAYWGDDLLATGLPNTILIGSPDDEDLIGSARSDRIFAGDGHDILTGGDGYDWMDGGRGRDLILGGAGHDSMDGGADADTMHGGAGNDEYRVALLDGSQDTVSETGGNGTDTLHLLDVAAAALSFRRIGPMLVIEQPGRTGSVLIDSQFSGRATDRIELILAQDGLRYLKSDLVGTATPDILVGTLAGERISGADGNDIVTGGGGADTLFGGAGDDVLSGDAGADRLAGGLGNDVYRFRFATSGEDRVTEAAGGGTDRLDILDAAAVELGYRRSGNLLVIERAGTTARVVIEDHFSGIPTNRVEQVTATDGLRFLKSVLVGTATADILVGASGSETLNGGGGNDIIAGGGARDVLTGGLGADVFTFNAVSDSTAAAAGRDTIMDFSQAQGDRINLRPIDANTGLAGDQAFSFLGLGPTAGAGTLGFTQSGGNTLIQADVDGGGADFAILLAGVHTLVAGDFLL